MSRAKVTQDRIYSAAYHPEKSKDLIFFGGTCGLVSCNYERTPANNINISDKHGKLGIWDARAPADEIGDDNGDVASTEDREGGKYWQLQPHWPATSKSSISSIKLDPIDSHSVSNYLLFQLLLIPFIKFKN